MILHPTISEQCLHVEVSLTKDNSIDLQTMRLLVVLKLTSKWNSLAKSMEGCTWILQASLLNYTGHHFDFPAEHSCLKHSDWTRALLSHVTLPKNKLVFLRIQVHLRYANASSFTFLEICNESTIRSHPSVHAFLFSGENQFHGLKSIF